jgi:hypothetical protein
MYALGSSVPSKRWGLSGAWWFDKPRPPSPSASLLAQSGQLHFAADRFRLLQKAANQFSAIDLRKPRDQRFRQLRIQSAAAPFRNCEIPRFESVRKRKLQYLPINNWPKRFHQIVNQRNSVLAVAVNYPGARI